MFPEEVAVPLILGGLGMVLFYRVTYLFVSSMILRWASNRHYEFEAYSETDLLSAREAVARRVREYKNVTNRRPLLKPQVKLLKEIDSEIYHRGIQIRMTEKPALADAVMSPNELRQMLSEKWVKAPTPPKPVPDSGVGNSNYGLTYLNAAEPMGMPLEEAAKQIRNAMAGDVMHLPHGVEVVRDQYAEGVARFMQAYAESSAEEGAEDARRFGG